ncbi:DUF5672 family protein [Caballeronia sp. LZ062]|uniref:DUF5672 family protein n=1 Tax=unclassified Caballeronia TaxID=2646786 RepID=UPI0028673149|nr:MULTISPECIES: DUF5672 family protein [unclassified Caballeronia]MDR5854897.1 DUF5672 family protein [Caballeronia sp. LZ050]MDR5870574.1 DUF5672 family protein [Caballeronia sp. LZ062]
MKDFSKITLVSVTGMPDATRAVYALTLSLRQMPGARAVLCSPHAPASLPPGIEHRKIAPLNYQEYSWFMMYALWRVVETEFALIVQDDGWVLDTANWSDDFLDYDYVGPTAHVGRIDTKDGTRWVTRYTWSAELGKPGQTVMPVINGGFCLRSRRMMRALIDHPEIRMTIPAPDTIGGDPLKVEWTNCALNEDVQLTCVLRPELEAVGLRFAPIEVCLRFGIEHAGAVHRDVDMTSLFGQHCKWRRLIGIDPPTIQYRTKRSIAERAFREMDIARMLEARGYQLRFAPEDL